MKRGGGRRYYRPDDIALLRGIQHLLYGEGYTIRGAQRILKDHGVKFVQNVWRPGADQPARAGEAAEPETAPNRRRCVRRPNGHGAPRRIRRTGACSDCCPRSSPAASTRSASRKAAPPTPWTVRSRRRRRPTIQPAASAASLPADKLRKLQDTLRDLQECRKLLDAAVTGEA